MNDLSDDDEFDWLFPPENVHDTEAWDRYWQDQIAHEIGPELFDMFCFDQVLVDVLYERDKRTILYVGGGISREPRGLAEVGLDVQALDLSPFAIQFARENEGDQSSQQPEGALEFIVGDLFDPATCPGPFDVIIERRTVQGFSKDDRDRALRALAARLHPNGVFFSHCHDGAWKPPAKPFHATEAWFRAGDWTIWDGEPGPVSRGRVAWIHRTTG